MWWLIAVFIGTLVLAFAFRPKMPQPSDTKAEVTAPTAEVGREISVLFGCRDFNGANVTWWGALRLVAIKAKGGKK